MFMSLIILMGRPLRFGCQAKAGNDPFFVPAPWNLLFPLLAESSLSRMSDL
jgi:hypothetical protein